ncbi:MAG: glutamine-hydrolyzing GMP synthase [Thermoproteus sp.]
MDMGITDVERPRKAIVVNFGGQYAHLIARRLREAGLFAVLVQPEQLEDALRQDDVAAAVLSGGPKSVLEEEIRITPAIFEAQIPVLGICYGHQLIAKMLGGRVERGPGEYGDTKVSLLEDDPLLDGLDKEEIVWMSHGDYVAAAPPGFKILAISERGYIAAMRSVDRPIYGVQFHPEVSHTVKGRLIFSNFVEKVVGIRPSQRWDPASQIPNIVERIRASVGPHEKVLVAVSGGVDSTVTAVLTARAIGERAVPIFVNHGLFREGEPEEVLSALKRLGLDVVYVDASEKFLARLEGVEDCEERRRIIGETFAEVFAEVAAKIEGAGWLAQGTLYPDVIESGAVKGADRIKSHHNVAGLPRWLGLKVLEPLRDFYKDEVRAIGRALGLPEELVNRHPFPGPGLAVRVMGRFTREKLEIARKASRIVEEELRRAGLHDKVWQAFAAVGDDRWVGVKGDARAVGHVVIVRVVQSEDAMTADWPELGKEVLSRISSRITSEVPGVVMVAYAVTPKPPATIEPC